MKTLVGYDGEDDEPPPDKGFVPAQGQAVTVTDGPFEGFEGIVDNVDEEEGKVRVRLSMFGRETPATLDFRQVEKMV
jgi:transcription termination/antitermination protein NusG